MKTHYYTTTFFKKNVPKRSKAQNFCNAICRARTQQTIKELKVTLVLLSLENTKPNPELKKMGVEKISAVGVGNAAIGHAAVELSKAMFMPEHLKAATKGDLKSLENKLQRYQRIQNMKPNSYGQYAYFEVETGQVVFR